MVVLYGRRWFKLHWWPWRLQAVTKLADRMWELDIQPANLPLLPLLPLPSRSPELNPQKNVWQFMRQNWLSNRVFKSFDDIVDHCCYAWNILVDQPWKIMSIARRDWAVVGQSL